MDCLAVYDISDPKRLRRVAKTMERYGTRVQKSVFECELDAGTIRRMIQEAGLDMDREADSLRVYRINHEDRMEQKIIGVGEPAVFGPFWLT